MNFHCARAVRIAAAWAASTLVASANAATLLDQSFASGLGDFTVSGTASTGSSGVVLRGGSTPGRLQSRVISTANYSNLRLTVARSTLGLDSGEALTLTATVNGQTRTLEAPRSASGSASFALGSGVNSVSLQFALGASSRLESGTIGRVTLEGDADCTGGDCNPTPTLGATLVPDPSWTCGFPNGIPDPCC